MSTEVVVLWFAQLKTLDTSAASKHELQALTPCCWEVPLKLQLEVPFSTLMASPVPRKRPPKPARKHALFVEEFIVT
ncbi:MAG TPA: hypothetical protein VEU33_41860, partial [Archangium sp.]|nr:hypothetical protein [Archangium sp.]